MMAEAAPSFQLSDTVSAAGNFITKISSMSRSGTVSSQST
jgi:hypothetical protein